jgi:hypothetical protein
MSNETLPLGKSLRLAIVTSVGADYLECSFYDKLGEKPFRCPLPHPYAGRGGGVLVGFEKDTVVLVANATYERWFVVGIVPQMGFFNIDGVSDIRSDETSYPQLDEGEVILKGNPGQSVELLSNGNIAMDAGIGSKSYDLELSKYAQSLFLRADNVCSFTEAGRTIEGVVKRDLNDSETEETDVTDFLSGESYEAMLSKVGRSPQDDVHNRTTQVYKNLIRNPALIEKRELTYEYADSFGVRDVERERNASSPIVEGNDLELRQKVEALRKDPSIREERRTDVLDLNLRNYNHLIETVKGTVVDIYGNVLDLNRNVIPIPSAETILSSTTGLKTIYEYLRRSVKYHFEINSRKDVQDALPAVPTAANDNLLDHSRFSIDIDAEGLTKVNIPASSNTGNIPVLGRYLVSREVKDGRVVDNGAFKDGEGASKSPKDVRILQFGAKDDSGNLVGAKIVNDDYRPESINNTTITVGSAFHDLFKTANSILTNGKLQIPRGSTKATPPLNENINNKAQETRADPLPNAGGRSLHLNLDGSLEASIGSDSVDGKSLVLDTAGGTITHFGRDRNDRSIIHQSDGDVIIQVGGGGVVDKRFNTDQPISGRVEIHLYRTVEPTNPSKIIIDQDGMTIDIKGNTIIRSSGDLALMAGAKLLLHGDHIVKSGEVDETTRRITSAETFDGRSGWQPG